jgi:SLOG family YspA-like protein
MKTRPKPFRVIITGSREWPDKKKVWRVLDALLALRPGLVLIHGDCLTGADAQADAWAHARGLYPERHPADWRTKGKRAGPIRNAKMARLGARLCIAFRLPGSRGTRNMISEAKRHGIRVIVYKRKSTQRAER